MPPTHPKLRVARRALLAIAACAPLLSCTWPLKATGNAQPTPVPTAIESDEATDSALTGTVMPQIKF